MDCEGYKSSSGNGDVGRENGENGVDIGDRKINEYYIEINCSKL